MGANAIGYAVLAIAASASLVFVGILQPTSAGAAAFLAAWLALPYAILALGLRLFAKERTSAIAVTLVAALVAAGGLLFLVDVIFLRPDAQGGIAVFFTPAYQIVAIAVLLPACRWLVGRRVRP